MHPTALFRSRSDLQTYRARISFSVPTHVARRNCIAAGEIARVSLLASGIHLMPAERDITG